MIGLDGAGPCSKIFDFVRSYRETGVFFRRSGSKKNVSRETFLRCKVQRIYFASAGFKNFSTKRSLSPISEYFSLS
jgi:hypothetical protein